MGIFGFFKNIAISFLIILLLAMLSVFVISNVLQATLLDPSFYEDQFEKNNIYSATREMFIEGIGQGGEENMSIGTQTISQDLMTIAMRNALSDEWMKTETNKLVRKMLAYLKSESDTLELSISIRPRLINSFAAAVANETGLPESQVKAMTASQLQEQIPDPVELNDFEEMIKGSGMRMWITIADSMASQLLIVIVVLLAIIFALTMNVSHFSKIVGIPVLLEGIGFAAMSYVLPGMLSAAPMPEEVPVAAIESFLQPILSALMNWGILLIVAGAALLVFSFIYGLVAGKKK